VCQIAINFVLEFARDLQKLLETLEKEFGNLLVNGSAYYKKKIQKRASDLTEELCQKYKNTLNLEEDRYEEKSNIIIRNFDNRKFRIPEKFLVSPTYQIVKENYDSLLYAYERGDPSWDEFCYRLIQILLYEQNESLNIKFATLEKIRFFLSFSKINPFFDYNRLSNEFKTIKYKPRYETWRKDSSYETLFNKFLKKDKLFFQKHVVLASIPNYPAWNLQLSYFDGKDTFDFSKSKKLNYFPIQVIEGLDGKLIGIIALNSNQNKLGQEIESFSFYYNFNKFPTKKNKEKSIKLKQDSIFDSYIKFLDQNLNDEKENFNINYELNYDFNIQQKTEIYLNEFLKKKTINEFNLLYEKSLSKFQEKFISDTNKEHPTYRYLFKSMFTFPDFNLRDNFILILKKKRRNVEFTNFAVFLKYWSYLTMVYELKDKIIYNGFFLPSFNFSREIDYLSEITERLNTEFSLLISNKNIKSSIPSLFTLPSSDQYNENEKMWNLKEISFPINFPKKEEIIRYQIKEEKKLHNSYL